MGTIIIVLLIMTYVFKTGYMQPCKESTWKSSITAKSNAGIGEVIFILPESDEDGQLLTDMHLCITSKYFEIVHRNQSQISVKSCLPSHYTDVLHICSDYNGTCQGTLTLTVIPFWHRRVTPMKILILLSDTSKEEDVIDIMEHSSFGECSGFHLGCSISNINTGRLFWINSGNDHLFTYARGITYGLLYKLKITCSDRRDIKHCFWLPYGIIYIRVRFKVRHMSHAAKEVVLHKSDLQKSLANSERDLRKVSGRRQYTSYIHESTRSRIGIKTFQERSKRGDNCNFQQAGGRKKRDCDRAQGGTGSADQTTTLTTTLSITPSMATHLTNLQTATTSASTSQSTTSTTPSPSSTITQTTKHTPQSIKTTTNIISFTSSKTTTTKPPTTPYTLPLTSLKTTSTTKATTSIIKLITNSKKSSPATTKQTTTTRTTPSTTGSTRLLVTTYASSTTGAASSTTLTTLSITPKSSWLTIPLVELKTIPSTEQTATMNPTPTTSVSPSITMTTTLSTTWATTTSMLSTTLSTTASTSWTTTVSTSSTTSKTSPAILTNIILATQATTTSMPLNTRITPSTVDSTLNVLMTTAILTTATPATDTMHVAINATFSVPNAEQVSSNDFFDEPLNVVFLSTVAVLTAIGSTVGIIGCVYSMIARTKRKSISDERTSISSGISSHSSNSSGGLLSSNVMLSSTASKSPLTPVETV